MARHSVFRRPTQRLATILLLVTSLTHLAAAPTSAADSIRETTSLSFIPADASFFSSLLRNREQFDIFVNSKAFARLTYSGTHRGPILGVEPTGRKISYAGAAVFTFDEGKVADVWVLGDLHGLLGQLTDPPVAQ